MENSTSFVGFMQGTSHHLMADTLGVLILFAVSMIILIGFMQRTSDAKRALAATGFITLILALLFKALNFIPNLALYVVLILCALFIVLGTTRR